MIGNILNMNILYCKKNVMLNGESVEIELIYNNKMPVFCYKEQGAEKAGIFVDKHVYDTLKPEYLAALVAHEKGHIINGDIDNVGEAFINNAMRPWHALCGTLNKTEVKADLYAVNIVGYKTFVGAMYELVKIIQETSGMDPFSFHICTKEIMQRIKAVKAIKGGTV